jgi:hypothetical protein
MKRIQQVSQKMKRLRQKGLAPASLQFRLTLGIIALSLLGLGSIGMWTIWDMRQMLLVKHQQAMDTGALHISFGSSYKTSDFIVDTVQQWWDTLNPSAQQETQKIQIKVDNGPESRGVRTQFLNRIVALAAEIGKTIHLIYYPPYHSKYNPIERCWGILEQHWNGTQ